MTAFDRESSSAPASLKRPCHALLTAALLSEIVSGGNAFLMPVGFTSLQRIQIKNHLSDDQVAIHNNRKQARKPLFAGQYYNGDDQWADDSEPTYEQQTYWDDASFQQQPEQQSYEGSKRALLGGAALGTMMAINNAVGMSAGAEPAMAPVPPSNDAVTQQSVQSYSASSYSQQEVTLPYLEKQIQAAEDAVSNQAGAYESSASVIASAESTAAATSSTSETTAAFSPSFIRYTQEHLPGWIETGQKVYDAAAPKIVSGGQKIFAEVDKRVTPVLIEKEHELLGDENSAVLDKTLSGVASAGKMVAGMVGKAISLGIDGGIAVAKATPEVIKTGQQVYKTVDEKILPEVVDTSRKMKMIADKTVPEVMDTAGHAYDTIMPEFMNAEKQLENTVKTGMDMAMPVVKAIDNKLTPELNRIEREVLGEEGAAMFDKNVAEAVQQGQDAFQTVEKTIPQVLASGQKTVDTVAYTGRTVAAAVPVIVESGKQAYNTVDKGVSNAISVSQDIAGDLDRAAGKTAYAIESNLNGVTGTIDKTLPTILEMGRQAAESTTDIARGGKAIIDDVSGFVDDLKVDSTIDSAAKRFAATKPIYKEVTASVNDPNRLGKL